MCRTGCTWNVQNFTHCLKSHNSDQQWVEEAMQFPKASSTCRILYDPYYVSFLNKVMQSYKQRLIQIVKERSGPRPYNPSSSLRRSTSLCNLLPSIRIGDNTYRPLYVQRVSHALSTEVTHWTK